MRSQELTAAGVRAELEELKAEVGRLRARAAEAGLPATTRFSRYLETLEAKRSEVARRLEAIREAGDDAWDDIESGLTEARQRLAIAKLAAKSRFH